MLLSLVFGSAALLGQEPPAGLPSGLKAEMRASRPLFRTGEPVRLRFLVINATDEAVSIPLTGPADADAGARLPLELILGTAERPSLAISFESEPDRDVPAPAPSPNADEPQPTGGSVTIAPRGLLGFELDLLAYWPYLRYAGTYRVTWRPLGGHLGACVASFRIEPEMEAIMITDIPGHVSFRLAYDEAPLNVANFLELVRMGFYTNKTFHLVDSGFILLGGCPKGDGTGVRPDGKMVPAEFGGTPVDFGTLLMARRPSDPNSASCQFFIALGRLPDLDGQYTVIGHAYDAESRRTLRQLSSVPVNEFDRPRSPLVIRSINLVPVRGPSVQSLGLPGATRPTETPPSEK